MRAGMVTGVTCVTLVTGETWVILGGVCIGFPCREGQVFVRRKGKKKKKGTISAKSPVTAGICKLSHMGKIFLLKLDKEYE